MKKDRIKVYIALQILLLVMAFTGVFSKFAAQQVFLSFSFFLFYGLMLLLLVVYALGWQQIIKRLPLTVAFANKGVSLVYSLILGALIFGEVITWNRMLGCALAIVGVLLFVTDNSNEKAKEGQSI